jgi:hypothetical protein
MRLAAASVIIAIVLCAAFVARSQWAPFQAGIVPSGCTNGSTDLSTTCGVLTFAAIGDL